MRTHLITGTSRRANRTAARALAIFAVAAIAGGCAMNETQQRTATGAGVGALGGALIGGNRQGAAIGAAVGAAGGFLYDQSQQRQSAQAENARLRQENEALRRANQ